jgi:two-component system, NtrC family, sensor kinase
MMNVARFPIRIKILLAVLAMLLVVVGVITVAMAELLRRDKAAYVHDHAAQKAQQVAAEADARLAAEADGLRLVGRLLIDPQRGADGKEQALATLFDSFAELVAVTLHRTGSEPVSVFDAPSLSAAGVTADALTAARAARPLPPLAPGAVHVEAATVPAALPLAGVAVAVADGVVVEGYVRLDPLLALVRAASAGVVVTDGAGIPLAHGDSAGLAAGMPVEWLRDEAVLASGGRAAGGAAQLELDGRGYIAGFARGAATGVRAGVLIPIEAAYSTGRQLVRDLLGLSIGLFVAAALASLLVARRLTRSIERLSSATHAIARGQFDVDVAVGSHDEIALLAQSFNDMARELQARERQLEQAHLALVQSEKMAAFGQLGAGIAHEVKNPLTGIRGHAQLALRKLEPNHPLREKLQIIERETTRCTEIIGSLLKFARQERSEKAPLDVNEVIHDALAIVDHQLGLGRVTIERALATGLPRVRGNANQLQQVLLNLAINAQQAMGEGGGMLRVETRVAGGAVEIRVSDTGPGIPADVQRRIFEPFFTTKPAGQGTGLGLSVSYGIVKDHDGDIAVAIEPGRGAVFILTLPALAPAVAA